MAIFTLPAGITPDKSADFGLFGLMSNLNNYAEALTAPLTASGGIQITAAQYAQGIINVTVSSGGANVQLPSTAAILGVLGPTVATDGSYAEPFSLMNNGTGQTLTLTIGDSSTTLTGTATVANNTRRLFLITVNAAVTGVAPTLTVQNLGSITL